MSIASNAHYYSLAQIRPERRQDVLSLARRVATNRPRYDFVSKATGVPWFVVGILHAMHGDADFGLTALDAKPVTDANWEHFSIGEVKASGIKGPIQSVEAVLDALEQWNGTGYRDRGVLSAYLWAWTTVHDAGAFLTPSQFAAGAVPMRPGAAAILKALFEVDKLSLDLAAPPRAQPWAKAAPKRRRTQTKRGFGAMLAVLTLTSVAAGSLLLQRAQIADLKSDLSARDAEVSTLRQTLSDMQERERLVTNAPPAKSPSRAKPRPKKAAEPSPAWPF